ncbi:S9 family peptidase [Nesterenkonia jeotgali]|uniref:Dipeptidyl aminopeptidase/acylaminoacyl peptidase n=1 Tax=Nesterenkonia jeotgali TaxID=317018 RepID=A0A839FU75_9MICC|nr:alpha/beta fold hydrolase [Nesterenkonia jeotgali]MBA8921413.1 dipeptidyl aminopeptidase/acylaminoacyl peptidase [Nesterenkonia jeotgali]
MTQHSSRIFSDLDHYVAHPRLSGLTLSPDGSRLVTSVSTVNTAGDGYSAALWEIDPAGEHPARRLTRSAKGESAPAFSVSGDLYFTSSRPGEKPEQKGAALYRLPAAGGEAELVTRRAGGVSQPHCAQQAPVTLLSAPLLPGASSEQEQEQLHSRREDASVKAILHTGYPVRFWDHDLGPARPSLFALEPAATRGSEPAAASSPDSAASSDSATLSGSATSPVSDDDAAAGTADSEAVNLRHLTEGLGSRFGGEVQLSPDGSFVLISVIVPEARAGQRTALAVVDVASGERRMIADEPGYIFSAGVISPDGRTAAVVRSAQPTPERAPQPQLHLLDLQTGALTRLAAEADLWLSPATWLPDGSGLLALADQGGRGPVFRVDAASGAVHQVTSEDATYSAVLVHPAGHTAYGVRSSYAHPEEVVSIDLATGEATRLPNPHERPELPGTLSEVTAVGDDGAPVRAWLALPAEASAKDPAPLLLWIHGGPLNSWNAWTWRWNPWLMVAQGYAVLLPDPALSTGYGQEFVQRGWNSWGGHPFTDLMSITDATEAREDIDHTRTAAMGGSFGGYMANWIAGQTDRFSAIVTHASLWALDQFGPTTDMASYWRNELDEYMAAEHSPHLHVEKIVTPMLVIHGDKDYRVPIGEGLRLWYELLAKSGLPADEDGQTAHRFLYFPDENHWVLSPSHAKIWYQVVSGFLAEHLLGTASELPAELGLTAPAAD